MCSAQLPAESAAARLLQAQHEAEERERAQIKRLVLKANQQQERKRPSDEPLPVLQQSMLPVGGPPEVMHQDGYHVLAWLVTSVSMCAKVPVNICIAACASGIWSEARSRSASRLARSHP